MKRAIVSTCTPVLQLVTLVECGGIVNARAALDALDQVRANDAESSSGVRNPGS